MLPACFSLPSASTIATKPPVIDAVRVPPSAWMTSQSIHTVRSPSLSIATTERSERPIRRWISCVRPPTLPADDSRCVRVVVARGSMPYSAVTQPLPWPRRNGGTRSSIEAAQMTRVLPTSIRTEPSACSWKCGVMRVRRRSPGDRESARGMGWNRFLTMPGGRMSARLAGSGRRRSTCPASVSTSLPSIRIWTLVIDGRLTVRASTMA